MEKRKSCIFLHKDEWDRLKNVGVTQKPQKSNEYVQSLTEKSQKWVNSWPDSIQGHILKREKQRQEHVAKDRAIIKLFKKEQKEIWKQNDSIEKAKQIIFDESCYGRRLISALLESKTLEERDAQIEFIKKIKESSQSEAPYHKAIGRPLQNVINNTFEAEQVECRRETEKETARVNNAMYLTQLENMKNYNEREKKMEIEDLRLSAIINEKEAFKEAHEKEMFKKDLEEFKAEQKRIQDSKMFREKQEERLIEIWRKYEDRKNTMMKKIHEERFKKLQPVENYALVKKINEDKNNQYDEFVNKGVTALTRRMQIKAEEDNRKKEDEHKNRRLLLQSNKRLADDKSIVDSNNINQTCACDRLCIIPKSKSIPERNNVFRKKESTFASSTNKLDQKLKNSKKEQYPWSGIECAHAQFATRARQTLQECRYKRAARGVIDDYRKSHGLTSEELPIDNYV